MQFLQPAGDGRPGERPGSVDYRLDRRRALRALELGDIDRSDVCDAERELLRVGRSASEPAPDPCPVCDEDTLRHVRFVFGPRFPAHGRCITSDRELARIDDRPGHYRSYLVEVCVGCRWNHLLTIQPLGGRR